MVLGQDYYKKLLVFIQNTKNCPFSFTIRMPQTNSPLKLRRAKLGSTEIENSPKMKQCKNQPLTLSHQSKAQGQIAVAPLQNEIVNMKIICEFNSLHHFCSILFFGAVVAPVAAAVAAATAAPTALNFKAPPAFITVAILAPAASPAAAIARNTTVGFTPIAKSPLTKPL